MAIVPSASSSPNLTVAAQVVQARDQTIAMLTLAAKQLDEGRRDAVHEKEEALRKVEQLQKMKRKVEEERDEAVGQLKKRFAGHEAEAIESKKRITLLEERIELRDKRIDSPNNTASCTIG